jgi:predicted porin
MKRSPSLLCAAALALAGTAQAQNVTIYGLLDLAVEHITNVGAAGSGMTRMPSNTGTLPSRLGFRGTEDLGDGLSANFTLEMGLAPDIGGLGQGGRAWGRQVFVGLTGPWGTVSLGRQHTMLFYSILDADILGPNLYGTGSLDAGLPNARTDNTLAWRGRFGGLQVGATYSLGRDTVNAGPSPAGMNCGGESAADSKACRAWSALVKYDTAGWGAALAYDRAHGRSLGPAPDAVFGGLDSSSKTDSRVSANGWLRVAGTKLGAGLIRRHNEGDAVKPKGDLWYLGASYPLGNALTLEGQWQTLRYEDVDDRDSTLLAARLLYALSKRTVAYAQVAGIDNEPLAAVSVSAGAPGSAPAPGRSQTAVAFGLRHAF